MGKAVLVTPLYLSFAWILMISYQLFTETAVKTLIDIINLHWPVAGIWLNSRLEILVFIYSFAWVFVLSSVIPSLILGSERGVLVQFFVCLTLTFLAFILKDAINAYSGVSFMQSIGILQGAFTHLFTSLLYLSAPIILMLFIDLRNRRLKIDWDKIGT